MNANSKQIGEGQKAPKTWPYPYHYLAKPNGIGGKCVVFGPYDLATAEIHKAELYKLGMHVEILSEADAKDADIHGVNYLNILGDREAI